MQGGRGEQSIDHWNGPTACLCLSGNQTPTIGHRFVDCKNAPCKPRAQIGLQPSFKYNPAWRSGQGC